MWRRVLKWSASAPLLGATCLAGFALVATPLAAQDGTRYRPTLGPLSYALTKSVIGGSGYLVGRELGMKRIPAAVLAVVTPWAIGKAIALGQGHRVPLGDAVGDLAWSALVVVPVATHSIGWSVLTLSVVVVTCPRSSPKWC